VATDDPEEPFIHAGVRLWKYPHDENERWLVRHLAVEEGIPVYTGRINTDRFFHKFTEQWRPDLCLMATFGQKIPKRLFELPRFGFYNFHHSDTCWPSYPGPDPIAGMVRDGKTDVVITMHEVTEILDGGRCVARSDPVPLPANANSVKVHRRTWPQMGPFIRGQVIRLLNLPAPVVH
jgi:methionyl-tRNA formyltransferase